MLGNYLVILLSRTPPFLSAEDRLSREERVGYLDQADRFYADPEGFIVRQLLPRLPQRLVFFNTLRPNLDIIQDKYREVKTLFLTHFGGSSDGSVQGSLIRGFMMIGGDGGM